MARVDYLNTLINNMNELFVTYDIAMTITYVNKKVTEVMGYHPEDLLGKPILDYIIKEEREKVKKKRSNAVVQGSL